MDKKIDQFIGDYISQKQNELSKTLIDMECLKEMDETISNNHIADIIIYYYKNKYNFFFQ